MLSGSTCIGQLPTRRIALLPESDRSVVSKFHYPAWSVLVKTSLMLCTGAPPVASNSGYGSARAGDTFGSPASKEKIPRTSTIDRDDISRGYTLCQEHLLSYSVIALSSSEAAQDVDAQGKKGGRRSLGPPPESVCFNGRLESRHTINDGSEYLHFVLGGDTPDTGQPGCRNIGTIDAEFIFLSGTVRSQCL